MTELGQDLALGVEAPQQLVTIPIGADQLDRGLLLVGPIGALGQIDRTHAAATDLPLQLPRAQAGADPGIGCRAQGRLAQLVQQIRCGAIERQRAGPAQPLILGIGSQQRAQL
jgi:hypothetical protein